MLIIKVEQLAKAVERLPIIHSHDALVLLNYSSECRNFSVSCEHLIASITTFAILSKTRAFFHPECGPQRDAVAPGYSTC